MSRPPAVTSAGWQVVSSWPEQDQAELTRLLGQLNRELDQHGEP